MLNGIATFFRESYWARFLIPIGLILIIFSIFVFIGVDNTKSYIKTEAVVSKTELVEEAYTDLEGNHHEATYTVFVKYMVEETQYETEYGVFSNYQVNDKIIICYNPKNPNEIAQPNSIILPILLLIAGILSFAGGIVSAVVAIKKHKRLKEQEKEWSTAGN